MSWTIWSVACLRAASKQEMLSLSNQLCRCLFVALVAERTDGVTLGYLRNRYAQPHKQLRLFCKALAAASVLQAARSTGVRVRATRCW